jgi:hypothetical protein
LWLKGQQEGVVLGVAYRRGVGEEITGAAEGKMIKQVLTGHANVPL